MVLHEPAYSRIGRSGLAPFTVTRMISNFAQVEVRVIAPHDKADQWRSVNPIYRLERATDSAEVNIIPGVGQIGDRVGVDLQCLRLRHIASTECYEQESHQRHVERASRTEHPGRMTLTVSSAPRILR
jgi:hypothetical protein